MNAAGPGGMVTFTNPILNDRNARFTEEQATHLRCRLSFAFPGPSKSIQMKKYFTEKNALTVMVALFCLVMMIKSFFQKESLWEAVAFALAFSLSIEVICHRTKENN